MEPFFFASFSDVEAAFNLRMSSALFSARLNGFGFTIHPEHNIQTRKARDRAPGLDWRWISPAIIHPLVKSLSRDISLPRAFYE